MRWIAALLALLAFPALAGEPLVGPAGVIDGDSLRIAGTSIRLSGVAAPERHEPGGPEATAAMADIVRGQIVECRPTGSRSYNRVVAICCVGGVDVGETLIARGFARDCPRYSKGRYASAEPPAARALPLPGYCVPR